MVQPPPFKAFAGYTAPLQARGPRQALAKPLHHRRRSSSSRFAVLGGWIYQHDDIALMRALSIPHRRSGLLPRLRSSPK
ncbi:hypothetical protein NDU88_001791 [Pleurodeles waltl]|uniref:Uncharacterized protein n=1 Tax=Pleurodeles waltl TaxID=8319 RepID=A0AAV7LZM0_PLEWA|nr:hypothetical protein NDU88_001791 [Pleurodeles waltl]